MKNTKYIITAAKDGRVCKKDSDISVKKILEDFDFIEPMSGSIVSIVTKLGYRINFNESDIRVMGEDSTGVRGIKLKDGDNVTDIFVSNNKKLQLQGRGGCGIK